MGYRKTAKHNYLRKKPLQAKKPSRPKVRIPVPKIAHPASKSKAPKIELKTLSDGTILVLGKPTNNWKRSKISALAFEHDKAAKAQQERIFKAQKSHHCVIEVQVATWSGGYRYDLGCSLRGRSSHGIYSQFKTRKDLIAEVKRQIEQWERPQADHPTREKLLPREVYMETFTPTITKKDFFN